MGFFSSSKEAITPVLLETPEQQSAKQYLSSYWQKYGQNYDPTSPMSPYQAYTGTLSAAMPSSYGNIDSLLNSYMQQGDNSLLSAGQNQILNTLNGNYDPYTSNYYQSVRRGVLRDVEDAQNSLRQKAQASGMYSSLGRILDEADVAGQGQDRLNTVLSGLQQQERQNQLSVLPYAQSLGTYQAESPLRQLSAISSYGALPANWEQADLDRMYQEFVRQKTGQQYPVQVASNFLSSYQPNYSYQPYSTSPSILSSLLGYGSDIADIYSVFKKK